MAHQTYTIARTVNGAKMSLQSPFQRHSTWLIRETTAAIINHFNSKTRACMKKQHKTPSKFSSINRRKRTLCLPSTIKTWARSVSRSSRPLWKASRQFIASRQSTHKPATAPPVLSKCSICHSLISKPLPRLLNLAPMPSWCSYSGWCRILFLMAVMDNQSHKYSAWRKTSWRASTLKKSLARVATDLRKVTRCLGQ